MPERLTGLLLPAFTPRRQGDLGIGDTRALREWVDLAAAKKLGFLQLLPINHTGADDSPYNAISSVALEPLYLTMEEVPGISSESLAGAQEESRQSAAGPVAYPEVRIRKERLLREAWVNADRSDPEFLEFKAQESSWLVDFCHYRWLMHAARDTEVWESWPESWQTPEGALAAIAEARDKSPAEVDQMLDFFAWIQWLCFRQWRALKTYASEKGVKLMGDIPIGVSRYSADVFFHREEFDLDWSGGAPPETVFKHDLFIQRWGQNWGVPLYRWEKMREDGFIWWRQRIQKLAEIFHIFRIDHVLGFYRIYSFPWKPQLNAEFLDLTPEEAAEKTGGKLPGWAPRPDDTQENCAANRADGDLRLKMVLDAAGDAVVVGEDLGCVPEYVRPHLAELGIAGFRIPQWDEDEDGHVIPGDEFPECSFGTYATHDHTSLPMLWDEARRVSSSTTEDEDDVEKNAKYLRLMAEFAGLESTPPYGEVVKWKLLRALLRCRSRMVALMITDLFDLRDRINAPGTVGPHNWSFRLPWTIHELPAAPLDTLKNLILQTDRG
jgi:4-alpha-glucanotransferase